MRQVALSLRSGVRSEVTWAMNVLAVASADEALTETFVPSGILVELLIARSSETLARIFPALGALDEHYCESVSQCLPERAPALVARLFQSAAQRALAQPLEQRRTSSDHCAPPKKSASSSETPEISNHTKAKDVQVKQEPTEAVAQPTPTSQSLSTLNADANCSSEACAEGPLDDAFEDLLQEANPSAHVSGSRASVSWFNQLEEAERERAEECLSAFTVLRNLSYGGGVTMTRLAENQTLLQLSARVLLLGHRHARCPAAKRRRHMQYREEDGEKPEPSPSAPAEPKSELAAAADLVDSKWDELLRHLLECSLVLLANVSPHVDLTLLPISCCVPLLDGVVHWFVCETAVANEALAADTPSAQRLALETIARLALREGNVDHLMSVGPLSRTALLIEKLVDRCAALVWRLGEQQPPLAPPGQPNAVGGSRAPLPAGDQTELELMLIVLCSCMRAHEDYARLFVLLGGDPLVTLLVCYLEHSFHCILSEQQAPQMGRPGDRRHPGGRHTLPVSERAASRVSADIIRRALDSLRALHLASRALYADPASAHTTTSAGAAVDRRPQGARDERMLQLLLDWSALLAAWARPRLPGQPIGMSDPRDELSVALKPAVDALLAAILLP